jgi:O-antigen/teichoic acid export membrane protein
VSRTRRASITACFAYLQFGLAMVVGIGLVPFVLHQVGSRLYGYWLASGDVLAYAALADFGILGVVPWMIAEADGRRDRAAIRSLMSTAVWAAIGVSLLYVALVLLMWRVAPSVLKLSEAERAIIAGPLAVLAGVTAVVLPLRVATSALVGLQDVKFTGAISTGAWVLDVVLTVGLLLEGWGLYALAIGAAVPSLAGVLLAIGRLRVIAPDLVRGWPRPTPAHVVRLFREGFGAWLATWGWRLVAATDAIVIGALGHPQWITMLAMTTKLGQMLTQMSWVPGDSSLVGLAQLSGEGQPGRLRAAVSAVFRVYVGLASAGACIVLAANGGFVSGWVGPELFAGTGINTVLAAIMILSSLTHGLATITSVLGGRMQVGVATLVAGAVQTALAFGLGRRFGLAGVPAAALLAQGLVLIPLMLPALAHRTGVGLRALISDVARPWANRSLPVLVLCAVAAPSLQALPLWYAIPFGGVVGVAHLWIARRLILGYAPVAEMVRKRLARFPAAAALLT